MRSLEAGAAARMLGVKSGVRSGARRWEREGDEAKAQRADQDARTGHPPTEHRPQSPFRRRLGPGTLQLLKLWLMKHSDCHARHRDPAATRRRSVSRLQLPALESIAQLRCGD